MDVHIHGRTSELQVVQSVIERVNRERQTYVLEIVGPAGIGKSTIIDEAAQRAAAVGSVVWRASPTKPEASLGWASLRWLLLTVAPTEQLPPTLDALRQGAVPDGGATLVAFELFQLVTSTAAAGPLCIVVDDAMWLDELSLSAITVAMRADGPVLWVIGCRTDEPLQLPVDRILSTSRVRRVVLGGLGLRGIDSILRLHHSVAWLQPALRRVQRITEGHPLFVTEFARAAAAQHTQDPEVPRSVLAVFSARIEDLPPAARRLLGIAGLAVRPTLSTLRLTLGANEIDESLDEVERAGLGRLESEGFEFRHALVRVAAVDALTSGARRALLRLLADSTDDVVARANYLAALADGPDEEAAAMLQQAAELLRLSGANESATELLQRACELTPPSSSAALRSRRRQLLNVAASSGAWEIAHALATDLIDDPAYADDAAIVLDYALGMQHDFSKSELIEALDAMAARRPAGSVHDLAAAIIASRLSNGTDIRASHRRVVNAISRVGRSGQRQVELELTLRAMEAVTTTVLGHRSAIDPLVAAVPAWSDSGTLSPAGPLMETLVFADELERAGVICGQQVAATRSSSPSLAAIALAMMAEIEFKRGRLQAAVECNDEMLVLTGVMADEEDAYRDAFALQLRMLTDGPLASDRNELTELDNRSAGAEPIYRVQVLTFIAQCGALLGDYERVRVWLDEAHALADRAGLLHPGFAAFRDLLIEAQVRTGRLDDAEHTLVSFAEVVDRVGIASHSADLLRCRAILAAARGDTELAATLHHEAVSTARRGVRPLVIGRCEMERAAFAARQHSRVEAKAGFERAEAVFREMGAVPYVQRCEFELRRLGRSGDEQTLTESEANIARLVAAGKSNKEIATELFISVRTVESTLTRVYRKMSVRSRTEMVAQLAHGGI